MDPTPSLRSSPARAAAAAPALTAVPSAAAPPDRRLYRFAVAVVVVTLLHIKIGANVTSTGSGLAFTDWPLSRGQLWPKDMGLPGLFEHVHRISGAIVGLLVLALAVWIGVRDPRGWLRKLAIGALALIALIGVLGGLTVLAGLPPWTSILHGVLAQVALCVLALIAFALSAAWRARLPAAPSKVRTARRLAVIALALVFAQLLAGAVLRHTNAQGMLWLHIFNALFVAFVILITALYCGTRFPDAGFAGLGRLVMGVLLLQLGLGFATLGFRQVKDPANVEALGRSLIATAHVAVGALLFLAAALLTYRAFRNLLPDPARESWPGGGAMSRDELLPGRFLSACEEMPEEGRSRG